PLERKTAQVLCLVTGPVGVVRAARNEISRDVDAEVRRALTLRVLPEGFAHAVLELLPEGRAQELPQQIEHREPVEFRSDRAAFRRVGTRSVPVRPKPTRRCTAHASRPARSPEA